MNGIDVEEWNPETDRHLPVTARYTAATVVTGKAAAKAHFQQCYGLQADPAIPLVGMVGRLTAQKGTDVVLAALPGLLGYAALGTAEAQAGGGIMCTDCSLLLQSSATPLQLALLGSGCSLHLNPLLILPGLITYCIVWDTTCCIAWDSL